ncbi:MAG: hypothetical protein ABIZ49_14080, partial [Opitutaceae bacterium]
MRSSGALSRLVRAITRIVHGTQRFTEFSTIALFRSVRLRHTALRVMPARSPGHHQATLLR